MKTDEIHVRRAPRKDEISAGEVAIAMKRHNAASDVPAALSVSRVGDRTHSKVYVTTLLTRHVDGSTACMYTRPLAPMLRDQTTHHTHPEANPTSYVDRRRARAAIVVVLPCFECGGACCTGHRGVLLDDDSILPFEDGRCPHLTEIGQCGIYENRPRGCRRFDCSRDPAYLRAHPHVATLLRVHGVPVLRDPPAHDQ